MADEEQYTDHWGNDLAKWTWIGTSVAAFLFIAASLFFVMKANP